MSTLKHSIRQQQAQLHSLENIVLRGPRPLPPGFMTSSNHSHHASSDDVLDISHPPVSFNHNFSTPKMQRRSSFDVLQGLAGPDSSIPLPKRETISLILKSADGIREGIPMEFGGSSVHKDLIKRMSSPTRTLSRVSSLLPTILSCSDIVSRNTSGLCRLVLPLLFSSPKFLFFTLMMTQRS